MAEPVRLLVAGVNWPLETFLARLLRGLAGKGMRITLASENRPAQPWLDETGIEWLSVPLWRGSFSLGHLISESMRTLLLARKDGKNLWRTTRSKKNFLSRLANWNALSPFAGRRWDVVYFPWNFSAVNFLPLFELGMPVILSCRGSQILVAPHNPRRADILPGLHTTFVKAAAVHCVSQGILNQASLLGLDPAKAKVIYPAVDTYFFHPGVISNNPDGVFRVVATGSLNWVKGYEYALLAIRHLREAGVPADFEIIGDGHERNRLLFSVYDLGLQDYVHLTGHLAPEEIRMHLQQADVFLLSSVSEGISNALLEAMACGLPVVTSDCGGMREAVTDGVEGFVVPVRSPQAIADRLLALASDPQLRSKMGSAGRERVLRQFQAAEQLEQWQDVIQSVVGR